MKRRFTILTAALALLVSLAIPMGVWGQTRMEITWSASQQGYTNQQTIESVTFNSNVSAAFNKGTNNNPPKYYTSGTAIRCYGGNYFTISTSSGNLTSIAITFGSSDGSNAITTDVGTYSNGTWTGSATSVKFTIGGTSGNRRIAGFTINYSTGDNPNAVTPTFSPVGGTYAQAQTVTISSATEGATIYYTTNGDDPTTSSSVYSAPLTISQTTTVKAMAAATGYNNSAVASATYTITTPSTIAEVRAQGTGSVFTQGVVTSCVGTTGYIQDATAAICVFGTNLTVGSNITVQGTLSTYNGLLEIINPVVNTVSSGNTVNPSVMTIEEINDDYAGDNEWQGWFITIENATVTNIASVSGQQNTTIAQGDNTIVVRGSLGTGVNVEVGDVITLDGNIGCFNSVQIANPQNVTVQENTDPAILAENVSIASDATDGNIDFTIDNPVTGGVTSATTNDEWLTLGTVGSATVPFTCTANTATTARTATVVLTYTYNRATVTKEVTVTQAAYETPHVTWDLSTNSYDENPTDGFIQWSSVYATMTNEKNTSSQNVTNYIPPTRTSTRFYSGQKLTITPAVGYAITSVVFTATTEGYASALENSTWTNATASADGATITVTPTNGANAIEATIGATCGFTAVTVYYVENNSPSVTVTPATISAPFGGAGGTLAITYENLPDEFSFDYYFCDADGEELSEDPDWINAEIDVEDDVYSVSYTIDANDGEARTAYFKVYATVNEEEVYAIVSVNQAQYVIDYAVLPFVWEGGERSAFEALNGTSTYGVGDYATTQGIYRMKLDDDDDYILVKTDSQPGKVTIGVKMIGGANTSTITVQGSADGETFTDVEELTISGAQGDELTLETTNAFAANDRYVRMLFTKGSNVGVGPITITKVYTKHITGYTNDGGYYLIASPIGTVDPENVTNMITPNDDNNNRTYDLYRFDQNPSDGMEWRNYRATSDGFDLEIGQGYLYAHRTDVDLVFTGSAISESTYNVPLTKVAAASGLDFPNWNLVGNPFADVAHFANNHPFYTLDVSGAYTLVSDGSQTIERMEGVFVVAGENETQITFVKGESSKKSPKVTLNVSKGTEPGVIDRAIVCFGETRQMPKFQLFKNSTKVYIPMEGKDYALVRGEEMGAMPVNFKAEENGTYSMNFTCENVGFAYLHLIDNKTGNDVDLLKTPSYSFEAKTTDYESRFKLVFATGDNSSDDTFAFYSNGSFVINNEGNAELQVIDITGRIVKSESVNGCTNVNVNAAPGVYMLRLVNGDNVKVQKVVVK